jgi:hypothetical protein
MVRFVSAGPTSAQWGFYMAMSSAWQQYHAWNEALGSVLFTSANDGRPVYLDMDDDVLSQVALEAGVEPGDIQAHLAAAVRDTLNLSGAAASVFGQHLRDLRLWRRVTVKKSRDEGSIPPAPPVLALLAVLTLAAEEMQHDREFGGNAYYPRLFRVLGIEDGKQRTRLTTAYRQDAEELWGGLNEWLSAADGRLGLPTAYALSHRYIGLPLSQALVRSADRREFPLMFHRFGLPPGGETSSADMARLLDSWLQMRPCPVSKSLESLWQRGQARERIASVAAIELRSWDGTLPNTDPAGSPKTGDVQLLCWLRSFPRPRLEISFLARLRTQASPQTLTVLTAAGTPSIDVLPVAGARLQPVFTTQIDIASLVAGVLRLADTQTALEAVRFPRRIVPFRHDDLLNAFVECERVQLGEDSLLLVKDDHDLPGSVRSILTEIARPGFREESMFSGLPVGWVLFAAVQVVATPDPEPTSADLNALVPLMSSQLTLAGGTKLPGGLRKWSSLDPPEIRAVVQGAAALSVDLHSVHDVSDAPGLQHSWTGDGPTLVADIRNLALADGDYEVSLVDSGKTVHQATLRLRSSNTPDAATRHAMTPLAHDMGGDSLAALRATPLRPGARADTIVRGPSTGPHRMPLVTTTTGTDVWWNAPKPSVAPIQPITLAALDPASCIVTGRHYIELPLADGTAKRGLIRGVCRNCGLVKLYPAHIRWHRDGDQGGAKHQTPLRVDVSHLPAVGPGHSGWDVALDSLVHVRGGGFHSLEYVAGQVEESGLFTDVFIRSLEARGDLEVERGTDYAPARWELSPAYLAELATGQFLLTGCWSRDDKDALRDLGEKAGGTLTSERDLHGLARQFVAGLTQADLADIATTIGTAGVVLEAASQLVGALPSLSGLEAALPRVPLPSARRVLRFHLESASWVPVPSASEPGAYRLERALGRTDVFRTPADVEAGTAALTTVQLSKHLAARHAGRALLAYFPEQQVLAVPLGADLPGLYGRAAVLCGGRLPATDEKRRVLLYHDVPQRVADALHSLLIS